MDVLLKPCMLRGAVTPPPSKSQAHRLILAASLAEGVSRIGNVALSQDIEATIRCMEVLGASFAKRDGGLEVTGIGGKQIDFGGELPRFDCGESGSTLRFLIPIALAVAGGGVFTGRGRLMERPQKPYFDLFREKKIFYSRTDGRLTVRGSLEPGEYCLPGNVSSQFFTGLLYALPLLRSDSRIQSLTAVESSGYLAMTEAALKLAGVPVRHSDGWESFSVQGPAPYLPFACCVEADWSQAAFYKAAAGIGNAVMLAGMNANSVQGDRVIAVYGEKLRGAGEVTLDVSQCPDLVPALAVQAALRADETTCIVGAARLRIKESDRLDAVTCELSKLGAQITQAPDSLTIHGVTGFHGGTTDSRNDHRIAMMLAVAATRASGPVLLRDAGSVAKSYPNFWEDYRMLGGQMEEVHP